MSYFVYVFLVVCVHFGVGLLPVEEVEALRDIFESTNGHSWSWGPEESAGPQWFKNGTQGSLSSTDPCNEGGSAWQGVRCSGTPAECDSQICTVIYLQLPDYNIDGIFFHDSMVNLSNLQVLNMFSNPKLTGSILPSIGNLSNLFYMDFMGCAVIGTIPPEMGLLSNMWQIRFRDNFITGSLPTALTQLRGLEVLELSVNFINGALPAEYSSLDSLKIFDMKINFLSGTIPENYGLMTGLNNFEMFRNDLTGTIPSIMGEMSNLMVLDFDYNNLEGTIPVELGKLSLLMRLYFYSNKDLTGRIPSSMGNLTNLVELDLGAMDLIGTIPSELGKLIRLETFYLDENDHLTGSIPSILGNLLDIQTLWLHNNQLTSSLPVALSNLTKVKSMTLHGNNLTGSVLGGFSQLTQLSLLTMHRNFLTGSPLSTLFHLSNLQTLWLDNNAFTGTLSSHIQNLHLLSHLRLQNNSFSSTIPYTLVNCSNLKLFEADGNHLTGSLPPTLGNLTTLFVLKLGDNLLTGTVPFIGNLSSLEDLVLRGNSFHGDTSFGLSKFHKLEFLDISGNHFSGNIQLLGSLQSVVQMYIQGNLFTGSLDGVFINPNNMSIVNFDASDNRLSGSIPPDIFRFPHLTVVALSVNCFQGSLPDEICLANSASVISMDGLGAASECSHSFTLPFSSIEMFNTLEGSIPRCVFNMSTLRLLHLTGNGLTGSLSPLQNNSMMEYLHLSHNQITSTLPESFQTHAFTELDLSYNKITGEYKYPIVEFNLSSVIKLEINRLSGSLDVQELEKVSTLDVLRDNIFSCEHLPQNDNNINRYTCGSITLDDSYFVLLMIAVLVVICLIGIVAVRLMHKHRNGSCETIHIDFIGKTPWIRMYNLMNNIKFYLQYCEYELKVIDPSLYHIKSYVKELKTLSLRFLILSCICVIIVVPILLLKLIDQEREDEHKFVTHSHLYSWNYTLAYVTGELPAGLVMGAWVISCSSFIIFVNQILNDECHDELRSCSDACDEGFEYINGDVDKCINESTSIFKRNSKRLSDFFLAERFRSRTASSVTSSQNKKEGYVTKIRRHGIIASIGLVLINTGVVSVVNGLYIVYSTKVSSSVEVALQVALALFNVLYSIVIVPLFTVGLAKHSDAIQMRIWLLFINSLVIPCVVTAVTSPSCIQGVFVKGDEVTAQYTYTPDCALTLYSNTGDAVCIDTSDVVVDVAPLIPPFTYNYQCTSVILTAYIPVQIYAYSIRIIAPFFFLSLLNFVKYSTFPKFSRNSIPGVLFPDIWSKDQSNRGVRSDLLQLAKSNRLYNVKTVTANVIHNLIIFLTFGLCSPILAILIGTSSYFIISTWRIVISRFVHYRMQNVSGDDNVNRGIQDHSLRAMGALAMEAKGLIRLCVWPYVIASSFFFLFLCWDMSGDRVGWKRSLWIPILSVSVLGVMYLSVWTHDYSSSKIRSSGQIQHRESIKESSISIEGISEVFSDCEMKKMFEMKPIVHNPLQVAGATSSDV